MKTEIPTLAKDVFLTREQLCERLQISKKTLWQWHRQGKAPAKVQINGCARYPETLLDKFLEERVVA